MKRIIIFFLAIGLSFSQAQTWSSLTTNQALNYNALQDAITNGYFVAVGTITSTTLCVKKSDVAIYVNVNSTYTPYANLATNQIVTKDKLHPAGKTYYNFGGCIVGTSVGTLYLNFVTLIAYTDAQLTAAYNGGGNYYSNVSGGSVVQIATNGAISFGSPC